MESIGLMEKLPNETIWKVTINLEYPAILNLCKTNKQLNASCQSDDFWRFYVKEHYFIDEISNPNITARELAERVHRFLAKAWKNESVVDFRVPKLISDFFDPQYEDLMNANLKRQFITVVSAAYETDYPIDEFIEEFFGMSLGIFPSLPKDLTILTRLGRLDKLSDEYLGYMHALISFITDDTLYFTPKGLRNFPYDDLAWHYISLNLKQQLLAKKWAVAHLDQFETYVGNLVAINGIYLKKVYPIFH